MNVVVAAVTLMRGNSPGTQFMSQFVEKYAPD